VRAVVGRQLPLEDIVDLEDEALAETGSTILNSWVATIANLTQARAQGVAARRRAWRQPTHV
jgi:chemotaxis protein CheC